MLLIGKPSINGPFFMAMSNSQRVYIYIYIHIKNDIMIYNMMLCI